MAKKSKKAKKRAAPRRPRKAPASRRSPCTSPRRRAAHLRGACAPSAPLRRPSALPRASRKTSTRKAPPSASSSMRSPATRPRRLTAPKVGGTESDFRSLGRRDRAADRHQHRQVPPAAARHPGLRLAGQRRARRRQRDGLAQFESRDAGRRVHRRKDLAARRAETRRVRGRLRARASRRDAGAELLSRCQEQVAPRLRRREHPQPQEGQGARRRSRPADGLRLRRSTRSPARWSPSCRARPRWRGTSDTGVDEFGVVADLRDRGHRHARRRCAMPRSTSRPSTSASAIRRCWARACPGTLITAPWSKAAVSAHVNATVVATFLRDVLKRNNVDNKGGKLISTVNCVVKRDEAPGRQQELAERVLGRQADGLRPGRRSTARCARSPPRSTSSRTSCSTA